MSSVGTIGINSDFLNISGTTNINNIVVSGTASFPANSIASSAISGGGGGLTLTNNTTTTLNYIPFTSQATGSITAANTDSGLTYDASNNILSCPNFSGNASQVSTIQNLTNTSYFYLAFTGANNTTSAGTTIYTNSGLKVNPLSGYIFANQINSGIYNAASASATGNVAIGNNLTTGTITIGNSSQTGSITIGGNNTASIIIGGTTNGITTGFCKLSGDSSNYVLTATSAAGGTLTTGIYGSNTTTAIGATIQTQVNCFTFSAGTYNVSSAKSAITNGVWLVIGSITGSSGTTSAYQLSLSISSVSGSHCGYNQSIVNNPALAANTYTSIHCSSVITTLGGLYLVLTSPAYTVYSGQFQCTRIA